MPLSERSLVVLMALIVSGCTERGKGATARDHVEATWYDATIYVSDTNRPVPLHAPFPFVRFNVLLRNETEETVSFFRSGNNLRNGMIIGSNPDDPGRFLLIGPDTTLSLYAGEQADEMTWGSVAPGDSVALALLTDNLWMFPPPNSGAGPPTFVVPDSASLATFFHRAISQGHLIYVEEDNLRDTLEIVRAPDATVQVESSDS